MSQPNFDEIAAQLRGLSEKLKKAMSETERRALLKEFRAVLDQADIATRVEALGSGG